MNPAATEVFLCACKISTATCPLRLAQHLQGKKAIAALIGRTGLARKADFEFESETEVRVCCPKFSDGPEIVIVAT
jgi:hypothetical protein